MKNTHDEKKMELSEVIHDIGYKVTWYAEKTTGTSHRVPIANKEKRVEILYNPKHRCGSIENK